MNFALRCCFLDWKVFSSKENSPTRIIKNIHLKIYLSLKSFPLKIGIFSRIVQSKVATNVHKIMPRCNQRRYFSLTKAGIFLQLLVIIFSSMHHNFFFREYICSLLLIKLGGIFFSWKTSVILRKKVCNILPQFLRIFFLNCVCKMIERRAKRL